MVDGDPAGDKLYLMNAASGAIEREVPVSPAPHGVVVSAGGRTVWTTTLVEGTVQAIDGDTGEVLSTTSVGNKPNGITCIPRRWSHAVIEHALRSAVRTHKTSGRFPDEPARTDATRSTATNRGAAAARESAARRLRSISAVSIGTFEAMETCRPFPSRRT